MILHLAIRADWEQAKLSGNYPWSTRGISVADEGYTHTAATRVSGRVFAIVSIAILLIVI
jgi:uncharacterized protein (DUF952 family)